MRKPLVAVVIAALAVLTLTGAARGTDSGDRSHGRGQTLAFDVQFSGFFLLDFGPDGVREVTDLSQASPSRGDQIVFQDTLLRRGTQVGEGGGTCTVTAVVAPADPPILLSCQVTYQLPGGQIAAQGRASNDAVKTLAVVGGTGRYTGAGGTLVLTEFGNEENTGSVVITLDRR